MSPRDKIKKSFADGRLIPFVGAGFSMCVESSPSWEGVLSALAKKLNSPSDEKRRLFDTFAGTPWERLEFYVRLKGKGGRDDVKNMLTAKFSEMEAGVKNKRMPCQEALTKSFRRIYTTNYDHLFELACTKTGRRPLSIYSAHVNEPEPCCRQHWISNISTRPKDRTVQIIKFHGDYGNGNNRIQDTMVLTESDYYDRLIDVDAKDMMFMRDLLFYDILFLGYSLRDPNLKYVLHQMKRLKKEIDPDPDFNPRFFLATPENNPSKTEYFEKVYGIKSICIEDMCTNQKSGCLEYRLDKSKRNGYLSDKVLVIPQFSILWNLAENADAEDEVWSKAFEKAFNKDDISASLQKRCRHQVRRLLPRVQRDCYWSFLKEITSR
jgi:hypothetical protein